MFPIPEKTAFLNNRLFTPMATLIIFTLLFLSNSAASTPLIASILGTLGFHELAAANLTVATSATIFAPTDSSLLTCPNCSASLLQEHSVPGLYPIHFLRRLPFATKIQTLAPDRCLTVTASAAAKVFINGVEIAKPDFFNNGLIIVHALQGYLSPLSPNSCTVESMNTLSYTQQRPSASIMRFMLKDAMSGLRVTGYSVAALALRLRYADLLELKKMTLFAVDDVSIFVDGSRGGGGGGQTYAVEMGFHIVPNRLLTAAELIRLPRGAKLRTMESGRSLVVTTGGDAGVLEPMRINFVRVERFDLVVNKRIAVHGVSTPFRDVNNPFSTQDSVSMAVKAPVV